MLNVPSYYKTLFKIRELNSFAVLKIKKQENLAIQ